MKKLLSIFLIALTAFGCSDFLDEDNKGGTTNDEFYATATGYGTLMTASYATLKTTFGATDTTGSVATCPWLLLAGTDLYQKTRQNDHLGEYEYVSLYPSDLYVLEYYSNCYKAIQTINMALYYNDRPTDLAEATRLQYQAELRFLRAFYHFLLVEQFGGIVIDDEVTLLEPRTNIPKSSLSECYDFIISEIEDCVDNLSTNAVARVTQNVANHFLAKIYLTRAWDLGNSADFTTAKTYAQKVIDAMGDITLTYEKLWSPYNQNNSEIIFAVQYDVNSIGSTTKGNTQQALFGQYMGGVETNQKLMLTQLIPAWSLHKWYAANDNRYNNSFMLTVYEKYFDYYTASDTSKLKVRAYYPRFWGHNFTKADRDAWKATHDTIKSFVCYPFLENDEVAYRANFQRDFYTPSIKKFDSPQSSTYGSGNTNASVRDIILARLAEDYFLYAEACIGLNDYTTAHTYVQAVLDRPGNARYGALTDTIDNATTQQQALESYLIESGKEFVGEYNGRWPELRRTGMLQYMVEKYNYDIKVQGVSLSWNKYKYRPFPEMAFTLNSGLKAEDQNQGY
jgi:starch-binding outer membrane protein, SusD/RagB family